MNDDITSIPPSVLSHPIGSGSGGEPNPVESSFTSPSEDPTYASKVPPDHPGLRLDRPRSRTLRTGPAIGAAVALLLAGGGAVAVATRPSSEESAKAEETMEPAKTVQIAEALQAAPGNDAPLRAAASAPKLGPPLPGRSSSDGPAGSLPATSNPNFDAPASPESQRREARREALLADRDRARAAPLLANFDDPGQGEATPVQAEQRNRQQPAAAAATDIAGLSPSSLPPAGQTAGSGDPNMQQRKNDFLAHAGINNAATLDQPIRRPRSPYELLAGAVIPTSLITGIDSDLPGQILGQVRENVYDTVTGQYLLIPQGSRLAATYDSMVGFGQERVLVCWNRLIRPDGVSVTLECMPGIDLAGYSGFEDQVDHHWWRLLTGVAIGSLISAGAQASQGNVTGLQPTLPQLWVGGAAAGVNQATQQLTQKNLAIQPTIKIRPGFSVNVLVTKDLVLPPVQPPFQGVTP